MLGQPEAGAQQLSITGGFGAAILEHLSETGITTPVVRIAWPDHFVEHGKVPQLREKYGFTESAVADRIRQRLLNTEIDPAKETSAA